MSRIGKPRSRSPGVDVAIEGAQVTVKGPWRATCRTPWSRPSPSSRVKASSTSSAPTTSGEQGLHGLTRTLVNNMVVGCHRGLREEARDRGRRLPRPVQGPDPAGVPARLLAPDHVQRARRHHLRGGGPRRSSACRASTKQLVGEVAANIRKLRKPEPYRGKGVRYAGEHIRRKVGKARQPWRSHPRTTSTPRHARSSGCAARSAGRKKVSGTSERPAWSSPAPRRHRPGRRRPRRQDAGVGVPWRPTCAASRATRPPRRRSRRAGAERAKARCRGGIFDRAGNKYHGRIAAWPTEPARAASASDRKIRRERRNSLMSGAQRGQRGGERRTGGGRDDRRGPGARRPPTSSASLRSTASPRS